MPVSSQARERVAQLLPGERIDYLFPATLLRSPIGNVFVAITPRAITVFTTGVFGRALPKSVLAQYSRRTRLGPIDQHGIPSFRLGGLWYEVDDEYLAVINAADLEATGDLPEDPLPDL